MSLSWFTAQHRYTDIVAVSKLWTEQLKQYSFYYKIDEFNVKFTKINISTAIAECS